MRDEEEAKDNDGGINLFPYLSDLNEDLIVSILGYVAEAPFEHLPENYSKSSLTHTLPHVSHKFYSLSQKDCYWKEAIVRQVQKQPFLWLEGLKRVIAGVRETQTNSIGKEGPEDESATDLVERVHMNLGGLTTYKSIYQRVVSKHLRFKGLVFHKAGTVALGEPYAINLSEPRDRVLIREVMAGQPDEAKRGGRVVGDALFIHANRMPTTSTPAVLVQVLRCQLPDNDADGGVGGGEVVLLPCSHVWLEKLWLKPHGGDLHYAQCLRMGKQGAHDMNRLARQEALVHVMDRLASYIGEIATSDTDDDTEYDTDDDDSDFDDDGSLNSIVLDGR